MEQVIQLMQARFSAILPQSLADSGAELTDQIKQILRETLSKLDLVTREEFAAQQAVLTRAQARLKQLEQRIAILEAEEKEQS
jgi:BMFP domain-containing protein YqiC